MKRISIILIILVLLAACSPKTAATEQPGAVSSAYPAGDATNSAFIPQVSGGATQPAYPATAETAETTPGASETAEITPIGTASGPVHIYLVALEDQGVSGKLIGCNDSLVPVEISVDAAADPLQAALGVLLGIKDPYYGQSGLYNALYQSNLTVDKIEIEDNELKVELVGAVLLGGVCDNPRFAAQLTDTVAQFAGGRQVKIEINDQSLDEFISQQ